jgi:hypothetical protein
MSDESALSLVRRSNRFDLIFKYVFAKEYISNSLSTHTVQAYLSSIQAFNGFFEEEPRKSGAGDFVLAFTSLIDDMMRRGYVQGEEPVWINRAGQLLGGAHRTSIAAVLKLSVPALEVDRQIPWNSSFFLRRGLPDEIGAWAAIEFAKLNPEARLLTVHACVPKKRDNELLQLVDGIGFTFYSNEFELSRDKYVNLKYVNYRLSRSDNAWGGNPADNYEGLRRHAASSFGPFGVRNFLVVADTQDLLVLKEKFRSVAGRKNFSLHSTDTHEETIHAAEMLLGAENVRWLENASLGPEVELARDSVEAIVSCLGPESRMRERIVLSGSFALAAYGLRAARDADYICLDGSLESLARQGIDSHFSSAGFYSVHPRDLVTDPSNYFWFFGLKSVTPLQTLRFKANRFEVPKDVQDVSLLLGIFHRGLSIRRFEASEALPPYGVRIKNVVREFQMNPFRLLRSFVPRCFRLVVRTVRRFGGKTL